MASPIMTTASMRAVRFACASLLIQSRLRKFEQDAKWSFCLTAGTIGPRIRREHEETTAPEPHTGLQGEGGTCCRQGRPDDSPTGRAL